MRKHGKFNLYTELDDIRKLQTVKAPTSDDIRLSDDCTGYTSGWACAIYRVKHNDFIIRYRETVESCIEYIEGMKEMFKMYPDVFGETGDCYIFRSGGYIKANWWLHSIVIENGGE